ncbi:MAG: hypothetical protein V9E94_20615 [Microthrixaceae bacterium]
MQTFTHVPADVLVTLEHLVEAGGAEHLGRGAADELGDVRHGVVGQVAVLLLGEVAAAGSVADFGTRVAGDDLTCAARRSSGVNRAISDRPLP